MSSQTKDSQSPVWLHGLFFLSAFTCVYFLFPYLLKDMRIEPATYQWFVYRLRFCFLFVITGRFIIELADPKWSSRLQTVTLLTAFLVFRWNIDHLLFSFITLCTPLLLFLILVLFRQQKRQNQAITIVFGTLLMPFLLAVYFMPKELPHYVVLSVVGSTTNFLIATASMAEYAHKPWAAIFRSMFSNFFFYGPFPLENFVKFNSSLRLKLNGILCMFISYVVVSLLVQNDAIRFRFFPLEELQQGHVLMAIVHSLAAWAHITIFVATAMFSTCGMLWLLGMDVPTPMNQPWLSTNFADYWRRSNVSRYEMCRRVYIPYVAKWKEPWMLIGIVGIFLISAIHHIYPEDPTIKWKLLRWTIEGSVTAITIWWLRRQNRFRLLSSTQPKTKNSTLYTIMAILLVLIAQGFLLELGVLANIYR